MRCNIARSIAGGGGSVVVGTYTGNGGTQSITFDAAPAAVFIKANGDQRFETLVTRETGLAFAELNGNVITLKNDNNGGYYVNNAGTVYSYIAFF